MDKDKVTPDDKAIVAVNPDQIPAELPILALSDLVAFPSLNMSLAAPLKAMPILEETIKTNRLVGVVGSRVPADEFQLPGDLCETGTVVRILYVTQATDNTVLVIVNGLKRFRVAHWIPDEHRLKAAIELAPEIRESDLETRALHRSVRDLTGEVFSYNDDVPNEAIEGLYGIKDPLHLAYIAAAHSRFDFEERQALLEEDSLKAKLQMLMRSLTREKEILSLGKKIKSETSCLLRPPAWTAVAD